MERLYEVVVMGATGFTGRLIVEYLLRQYGVGKSLRWAIAGRSVEKLNNTLTSTGFLSGDSNGASAVPVIIVDSYDKESLNAMCAQTDCVVSTTGPFMLYGSLLIKCCIENGTSYCDSTGESIWVRKMIDEYQDMAISKKVRLVPSCAYDSLPSDLGVLTMVKGMEKKGEKSIGQLTHYIGPTLGGVSGGTFYTITEMMNTKDKKLLREMYSDPYALVPKNLRKDQGNDTGNQKWAHWVDSQKVYSAPFLMASSNEPLVRRSAALLGYGRDFKYLEVIAFRSAVKAFMTAFAISVGMIFMTLSPVRWIAKKFMPSPGEGPSRSTMENGYGFSTITASSQDGKAHYVVEVGITKGDAGYRSTSFMLAESAIALARSKNKEGMYGFLTPATCPGLQSDLVETLGEKCGIYFKFSEHQNLKDARQLVKTFDSKI